MIYNEIALAHTGSGLGPDGNGYAEVDVKVEDCMRGTQPVALSPYKQKYRRDA